MEVFLLALELIGTAAFSVSGAMLGMQKRMDLFGVCIMGLVTACGGGVLRDLFLDRLPPIVFLEPVFALTAICAAIAVFLPLLRRPLTARGRAYETVMLWADSLGLGIFTAAGVAAAIRAGYGDSFFFAVFLGTITGVGGGVLRDMLAGTPPYIFVKHIYACAAIAGAVACVLLWPRLGETPAILLCCGTVLILRLLAAHFRWSLPRAKDPSLPENG